MQEMTTIATAKVGDEGNMEVDKVEDKKEEEKNEKESGEISSEVKK